MRFGFVGAVTAVAIAMSPMVVSANTVTLQQTNPDDLYDGVDPLSVSVRAPEPIGRVNASIGAFRLTDSVNNFLAFCASLADVLAVPAEYTVTQTPFENREILSEGVRTRIQTLFDQSYSIALTNDTNDSAAFQLALWNILIDTNDTVTSGAFRYRNPDPDVAARADAFLAALNLGPDEVVEQQWILTYWEAADEEGNVGVPGSQNLITAAPIPLPAAAWMLLGALAAVAGVSRVRRRTA